MIRRAAWAIGLVLLASPAVAQSPAQIDSLRAEAVRSRAFIRAAETQLSKVLDLIARLVGEPIGEPVPTVPPDSTPAPEPSGSVLFASDWSAGDLLDGGRWTAIGNGRANRVVSSAGLDFPTPNVLDARVEFTGSMAPTQLVRTTSLPAIAVGDERGYRAYLRVMTPDAYDALAGADSHTHPIQDGNAAGDSNWMLQVFTGPGLWQLRFSTPLGPFAAPALQKGVTYRIEWLIERSAAGYALHVRIYDSAGTLLHGDADMDHLWSAGTLATAGAMQFGNPTTGLNAGHNGVASAVGAGLYPFTLYYQGAIAACASWCGPWR